MVVFGDMVDNFGVFYCFCLELVLFLLCIMRKGGITYNGIEDEVRCPKCGYFCFSVRPKLLNGQTVYIICRKCNHNGNITKNSIEV